MKKKTCFVVMGFGKKMDYENSREVDLDRIYKQVVKGLFDSELHDYELIRADEIAGSALIDVSMYKLLMCADLVIADITTLNPNALYELGVRHALKPYSTIIMVEEKCKIPFDLSHSRCLTYKEVGEKLDEHEAKEIKENLKRFITACENNEVDSPFYTFLPKIKPPTLDEEEYDKILEDVKRKSENISSLVEQAENHRNNSQFDKAIPIWKKLKELLPNNDYIIQQFALATYKAKIPNETMALEAGLDIIKSLIPENSLDLETLGITGAIYKKLFLLNDNFDYLDEAIRYYQKGFIIKNDYYNGENFATCLLLKTQKMSLTEEEIGYLNYESKKVQQQIIDIIYSSIDDNEVNKWMYATLATCYFSLNNTNKHQYYQKLFFDNCGVEWEKNSYLGTIELLKSLL